MKPINLTESDIQYVIANKFFNPVTHIILTNTTFLSGGLHEKDLLVVTGSNYAYEVEIKISLEDCKRDMKKRHGHKSDKIKRLYFAVPSAIYEKCLPYIPARARILEIRQKTDWKHGIYLSVWERRYPTSETKTQKLTECEVNKIVRFAANRQWTLLKNKMKNKYAGVKFSERMWR